MADNTISDYLNTVGSSSDDMQIGSSNQSLNDVGAFYKLLVAEIGNQDPTNPMDNKELVLQLSQFSTLEATKELNTNMTTFIEQNALSSATGLIGKEVTYLDVDGTGESVTGVATAIARTSDDSFAVVINGIQIPVDYVLNVAEAPVSEAAVADDTSA
jgi:flagellar basal-body rod modification protein FlgD